MSRAGQFHISLAGNQPLPAVKALPCQQERGVILIVLLWTLTLLSLLALNMASSVRTTSELAHSEGESERAYFYARGGLEEAIYRICYAPADEEKQKALFPFDGGMNHYWVQNEEFVCHVAIQDEAGKLDLNFAPKETLESLFRQVGTEEGLSARLAESIEEWRGIPTDREALPNDPLAPGSPVQVTRHGPFKYVEELLQLPGMTRSLLYGSLEPDEEDKPRLRRGLAEFVTVYTQKNSINPNYAELEVLAALPGMDREEAQEILRARQQGPFKGGGEIMERTALLLQGETASSLNTQMSDYLSLVATASVRGSKIRRSIRAVIKKDIRLKMLHQRLLWQDEFWASSLVLRQFSMSENQGEKRN